MRETIPNKKFNLFLRSLSNLTDNFNDADIRDGFFRARRNDSQMAVEIDFTDITHANIPLLMLKDKLKLLKCFNNSENIYLEVNEGDDYFNISDDYTELSFRYTIDEDLVNNKFRTEEELNLSAGIKEENKIIDTEISESVSSRIKKISSSFDADNIQLVFNGNNAKLSLKKGEETANFCGDINVSESITGKSNIILKPFIVDHNGPIRVEIFKSERVRDYIVVKSTVKLSDKEGTESINMVFYSKGRIINPEE